MTIMQSSASPSVYTTSGRHRENAKLKEMACRYALFITAYDAMATMLRGASLAMSAHSWTREATGRRTPALRIC